MKEILGHRDSLLSNSQGLVATFQSIKIWLKKNGLSVSTGRLFQYDQFLNYIQALPKDEKPKYNMLELALFYREISELAFVFSRFVEMEADLTYDILKIIFRGHALPTEVPEVEKCRNYLLQLRAAAYFMDAGFQVQVSTDADVIAKKGGKVYYIECKRIYSLSQVDKRLSEIAKQLSTRFGNHKDDCEAFGIGWIDPTPILVRNFGMYAANTRIACQTAARIDLDIFIGHCPFEKLLKHSGIIAAVFQTIWPSVCSDEEGPISIGFTSLIQPLVPKSEFQQKVRPLFDEVFKNKGMAENGRTGG